MSKTKKRWETSQAIQQKIAELRENINQLISESESHNRTFQELIRRPRPRDKEAAKDHEAQIEWEQKQRDIKKRKAKRTEETTIPKLIERLAEFNTNLLPCCGDDRSVPQ